MSRYRHHKYTWQNPFGSHRHQWELVAPNGATHFHVIESEKYGDSAGLEIHYCQAPDYMGTIAPAHINCPLTGGRCWHDGTSLYASETLWPMLQPLVRRGAHEAIFRILEREADERFGFSTSKGDEA